MKRFKKNEYIGKRYQNNDGHWMTVVEYHRTDNVIVEFELSKNKKKSQMSHIKRGSVKDLVYIKSLKRTKEQYNEDRISASADKYIGKVYKNRSNQEFVVLEYSGKYNVKIKFNNTGTIKTVGSSHLDDGSIIDENDTSDYYGKLIGSKLNNQRGYEFEILQISDDRKLVLIQFTLTNYQTWADTNSAREGKVKDVYMRDVQGVGYLGLPEKNIAYYEKARNLWSGMIRRCYDVNFRKEATYAKAQVSERWSCFQFFLEDLPKLKRFDRWLTEPMHLDKDLIGDSTIYDVTTCLFLTPEENRKEQEFRYKGLDLEITL